MPKAQSYIKAIDRYFTDLLDKYKIINILTEMMKAKF